MNGEQTLGSSDLSAPSRPDDIVLIDPDGDLILLVGSGRNNMKPAFFRVCASTLRRASPFWKAMLFGPWKESKPADGTDSWIVDLPKDDPKHLRVLLDIVHSNISAVPERPHYTSGLAGIVILADKFQMIRHLRPWSNGWASILRATTTDPSYSYDTEHCWVDHFTKARAAWNLGCEDAFDQESRSLLFNSKVSITAKGTFAPQNPPRHLVTDCSWPNQITEVKGAGLEDFEGAVNFKLDGQC